MSNQVEKRALARTALTLVLSGVLALLLFSTGPTAASFAQTPAPSGSATPSPTPTGTVAYDINFINPSGNGHSEELGDKDDRSGGPSGNTYHLVAWINQVPSDVRVEFRYELPDSNEEELIAEATQVNPGDTFEAYWDVPDEIAEGPETFTLHAILYSGQTELDRDSESDLNKNSMSPPNETHPDDQENAADTVEFTYPTNGGPVGFFIPRDRDAQGVFTISHSATSQNTPGANIRYTVSKPGSEPTWVACGSENTAAGINNGIRCTLSPSHQISAVTAVAVTVFSRNCSPSAPITGPACQNTKTDSGDAHRVIPYEQDPTAMTIVPDTQNEIAEDLCSNVLAVTVTDQNQRAIPAAEIDVHAIGPSDGLRFDDSGNNSSANDQPEGHAREATTDCESAPDPNPDAFQGEHNDPAGNDLKHIESTLSGGTNDAGQWFFQMFSPDRGETQLTAFVDEDSDDVFCSLELSASASIGWRVPAPAVDGPDPETETCTEPTPTPSVSQSPSATPSGSPTDDPRGCTVTGTDDSEALEGTDGDDIICAGDGNDLIRGLGGNDTIYGEGGADEVRGGAGNDSIEGGAGKDTIRGAVGNDGIEGGAQNDVLLGGAGADRLFGNNGFDAIRGGGGKDTASGGVGDDTIRGGAANDSLFGNAGRDILQGDQGRDRCRGGSGQDRLKSC